MLGRFLLGPHARIALGEALVLGVTSAAAERAGEGGRSMGLVFGLLEAEQCIIGVKTRTRTCMVSNFFHIALGSLRRD